jgi:hypothetical protein
MYVSFRVHVSIGSFPRRCRKVSIRKGSITKYQGYIPYRVSTTVIYWQTKFLLPSWNIGLQLEIAGLESRIILIFGAIKPKD